NSRDGAGNSYVVYGKNGGLGSTIDLRSPGSGQVTVIQGAVARDASGCSVSGAGDVNGDGIDDLIIGAYLASPNEISDAGNSYVVYGVTPSVTPPTSSPMPFSLTPSTILTPT